MTDQLLRYTIMIPPLLLSLTLHEYAHGWVAWRLGDPTAKQLGRLTLNPISHLDPIGTIAFILLNFGWAKPVPVNPRHFRNPIQGMCWVAAAGPAANLILAILSALLYKTLLPLLITEATHTVITKTVAIPLLGMLHASVWINLVLFVFNLLPVPPLDGSRIVAGILPPAMAQRWVQIERYGFIVILLLMMSGVIGHIIGPFISTLNNLLLS